MSQLISIASFLAFLGSTSAIRGGELANITELPHQVYIKYGGSLWCGGTIISSQHVLTKWSCVKTSSKFKSVIAATDDLKNGGDEYTFAKITEHAESDIAVIKLNKEINLSDKAKPIALAGPEYKFKNESKLIASGWGNTEKLLYPHHLRKLIISNVTDDDCEDAFDDFKPSEQFCAGGQGKKTCGGDQGGPLIEQTCEGNVLVGVIQSYFCKDKQNPSLFTKVSTFNEWINKIMKEDRE